jgi:8-oxo-dGTP diphosphatase
MGATIRIATALIDDGAGRLFLVRKRGTSAFMQPGGKIDPGETALDALVRELDEELGFAPARGEIGFLGTFCAEAANESGKYVEAQAFHIRCSGQAFGVGAELEEGIWVALDQAASLPLAPLTRNHMLPLARNLCGRQFGWKAESLDGSASCT